jgi:hypothetical protein
MSNSYPNVFYQTCRKKVPCESYTICGKPTQGINQEKLREKFNPKTGEIIKFNRVNQQPGCEGYANPSQALSYQNIKCEDKSQHSWSNYRGFGNMAITTHDTCNNIHTEIKKID